jgi:hypothetical protein
MPERAMLPSLLTLLLFTATCTTPAASVSARRKSTPWASTKP